MPKILIVDDQRNMRTTLAMMLRGVGYEVDEAADGDQGATSGATGAFDLVLTDLRMGQKDGIDVLRAIKERQPMTEVIVMTAYGTIESAVEAMRLGAFDYIQKPFTEQELLVKVQKALENRRLAGEVALLTREFKDRYKFENIVGRSSSIREVLGRVVRVAPTDATVLITGESGTGKELVAKAIHANIRRADRAFVSINCAALTETLLESELFGHAKGSFTGAHTARKGLFEEADGGTFFFDEIAETPSAVQAKLLRAIQEHEIRRVGENKPVHVDVRIVAATNQDLLKAVGEKRFRQDLYYRLNVARFSLPPLRERREDVALLAQHFLERCGREHGKEVRAFHPDALRALSAYSFPGNVRELENVVERAVALARASVIGLGDLPREVVGGAASPSPELFILPEEGCDLDQVLGEAERRLILQALDRTGGVRVQAAKLLGVSLRSLRYRLQKLGVATDEDKVEDEPASH
jgi:two-component system response regulator HydG